MKVLHLTLKKKYFDMVGNGKPEEYRELTYFWAKRLLVWWKIKVDKHHDGGMMLTVGDHEIKEFDQVLFANGGHFGNVPKKLFEFKGIEIREGNPEWGAEPGKKYFVIKLGKQLPL
jgi:hypothetical protein